MKFRKCQYLFSYLLLHPLSVISSSRGKGHAIAASRVVAFSTVRNNPTNNKAVSSKSLNGVKNRTRYTIDDEVCSPTDEKVLKKIVQNHCQHLDRYLENRPIASHTRAAFDSMMQEMPVLSSSLDSRRIILDSGCGTGRSTRHLGSIYPEHLIIGVDRSFARLNRNGINSNDQNESSSNDDDSTSKESLRPFQVVSDNIILVRAELTDFWRCCLDSNLEISKHYILYPNPYPTKKRIKQRFYGHPSFPLILKLGGDITLRSNWKGYLNEFSNSVQHAHTFYSKSSSDDPLTQNWALPYMESARLGPRERVDKSIAWTNFEKKYDTVGENTYELFLKNEAKIKI